MTGSPAAQSSALRIVPDSNSPATATAPAEARESHIQLDNVLRQVIATGASDLHLAVGLKPMMRRNGDLTPIQTRPLTEGDIVSCVKAMASERVQIALYENKSVDFSYELNGTRFRVNACKDLAGIKVSMRRLPDTFLSLKQIGIPAVLEKLIFAKRGLILITGETGSGKTTTLASLINHVTATEAKTVITIEQPIEYRLPHNKSLVMQREVGLHVPDFTSGLRDALRQDPEIIMVGEIRDLETIRVALSAAETGHLVFATLHTNSAAQTMSRLIDIFPEGERDQVRVQLSMSLKAVLCQQLLERADSNGRVAAMELMVMTPAIANHIRRGEPQQIISAMQTGAREGMRLFDDHLAELYATGVITYDTAMEYAQHPRQLESALRGVHPRAKPQT